MDQQKVISDWIIATTDTIYTLHMWLELLENWRQADRAEADDFMDGCLQLKEADLWQWASRAGGQGIEALAAAVRVKAPPLDERYRR